MTDSQRRFSRFAWAVLGFTLLVILWGGFVRASGAGAGCGDHWPLCNGEVIPRAPALNTVIEFSHRLTSALLGLLVIGMVVASFRRFPKGSRVRTAAVWSGVFVMTEALIGAGLVRFEYVAYNESIARAYWMGAHLINTFLLLAALTLTAHWAGTHANGADRPLRLRDHSGRTLALSVAALGMFVLGASGGVAALGDTLTLGGGLDPAANPVVATLVGLRIYHPILAFLVLALVGVSVWSVRRTSATEAGFAVLGLFLVQMALGTLNVWLMAPIWMQMVHLLMTDLIWIGFVLFAASALSAPEAAPSKASQFSPA